MSGGDAGFTQGEHQPVGPIEKGCGVDHVNDLGVIQSYCAQPRDM
jgi:hypothetical protein